MSQTSKINRRESDYEITFYRDDQELLKFYGREPDLMELAEIWKNDATCTKTINEAVRLGVI
jgi:hypothetical protein